MKKKFALLAALAAVIMGAFLPLVGSGQSVFGIPTAQAAQPYFSKPAFQRVWQTTDLSVDNGQAQRSFLWGPNFIDAGFERYDDAAPLGGQRRWVQYFDKTRMELNNPYGDPNSQFYVSNGLLVVELVSGRRQEGDNRFVDTGNPANNVVVAGDNIATNPNAPTYKTLRAIASYDDPSVAANRKPNRTGQKASETLTKDADGNGVVGNNAGLANYPGTDYVYFENTLGHNIPRIFWDYMNQTGPKFDSNSRTVVNGQKVFDWLYAMGYPITDAYWTRVKVAGVDRDVLLQCFQRRCLTYTPDNPAAYRVEMGNVGQHYFVWRYGQGGKMPSSEPINDPISNPMRVPNLGYGINAHLFYQNRDQITDWVKDLGSRWVRQQITWSDIEDATRTDADRFVWTELDKIVDSLYVNNIHIILSPIGTPPQYKSAGSGMPDPDKMGKFSEFMYALAQRYKGKVDAYEIWNEANLSRESGAGISPRRYLTMLQKGYNAVKEADPSALVLFGALSPTTTNDPNYAVPDTNFLRDIYAFNNGEVRNYFDIMAMHPGGQANAPETLYPENPGPSPAWNNSPEFYFRRIEALRKIMEDAGDGKKQVWLTEFGWSSDTNPPDGYGYAKLNSEQQQADYIRRAYQYAQANYPWMGVMALWNLNFSLPTVTHPNPNGTNDEKLGFAILRRDGSKRPAYAAYQQLAKAAK
ncbi:MAG TPA: cellulase family glycosylhydrolase [Chloroflexia bacterium]|nr:cellulase family glycosylhydrolase [Chloroflexia bacterium]